MDSDSICGVYVGASPSTISQVLIHACPFVSVLSMGYFSPLPPSSNKTLIKNYTSFDSVILSCQRNVRRII
jgi:hypothetical protein